MCLQADDQGILVGDLNMVQVAAKSLSLAFRRWESHKRRENTLDYSDSLVDLYLKLNFPDFFEALERQRLAEKGSMPTFDNMEAENMGDMLDKLRSVAGML